MVTQRGKVLYDKTPIRAAETEEGRKRLDDYELALGRFVGMFARIETAIQLALWHYARTPNTVARSLFSGTRAKEGVDLVRRIMEARGVSEEILADWKYISAQFSLINSARNNILHYGATSIAEGCGIVTNAFIAHIPEKISGVEISPEILTAMIVDLAKIMTHLFATHLGRPQPKGAANLAVREKALRATWLYRPRQVPPARSRKQAASDTRQKPRARRRQPKASSE